MVYNVKKALCYFRKKIHFFFLLKKSNISNDLSE